MSRQSFSISSFNEGFVLVVCAVRLSIFVLPPPPVRNPPPEAAKRAEEEKEGEGREGCKEVEEDEIDAIH